MRWLVRAALALGIFTLTGCYGPISIYQPIDLSMKGQSIKFPVEVDRRDYYTVSLGFAWGGSIESVAAFVDVVDGVDWKGGVPVKVRLLMAKDSEIFFDEVFLTSNITEQHFVGGEGARKVVGLRRLKNFALGPGRYSVEVLTMGDVPVLKGFEAFVAFYSDHTKI